MASRPAAALASRREQGMADRRARILKAARDLIRETGKTDLSMRMLAARAGVSLATPYNLFGSKRAVMLAVLEDERDFAQRFERLDAPDSIGRIFAAHDLAFGYYAADPDFYRTLWRALLDGSGGDPRRLISPERLKETRAGWIGLLGAAVADGYLEPAMPLSVLERALSQQAAGALLLWTMGALPTERLAPAVGLGYALLLGGVATAEGAGLLRRERDRYGRKLAAAADGASLDEPAADIFVNR